MRLAGGPSRWGMLLLAGAAMVAACETARNPGGVQRDVIAPTILLSNTVGDTQDIAAGLQFDVHATDNLGLKTIRLTYSGGYIAGPIDTTLTSAVTTLDIQEHIKFPGNSGAGGLIRIVGRAIDGAGNFAEDTIFIFLNNVQALKVFLISPLPNAVASTGKSFPVTVVAVQNQGIRKIGFQFSPSGSVTNPTTPPADSITFTPPYADSVTYTDTLDVSATTGTIVLVGFAEDSGGRRATSGTVQVLVQSAANDNTPPSVQVFVNPRVEVSDSALVHATDPSAISWIGVRIKNTAGTLLRFDSVAVGGNLTDVVRNFGLNLAGIISTFPTDITVEGYACDGAAARNCAFSTINGIVNGTPQADTASVVAGVTRALPAGGSIADAIFNANQNELYLTNPALSRVEIFQVANTSFVASGIPTAGPEPWGIALWPRDTLGAYGDTIVVANSGGTELSIIDVRPGVRRLAWRQDLPNYLIETYRVTKVGGGEQAVITAYDVSDRPQYLATVCRAAGTACSTDSIFALYSTTPTLSSTSPFSGKGTLRMEKLKNTQDTTQLFGHFFWEIGTTPAGAGTDTLRIELIRGLPYNQHRVILSACAGVTTVLNTFGLGDSTFARNSGNFTHAFFGEGGTQAAFARVMSYTAKLPLSIGNFATCNTGVTTTDQGFNDVDFGMSPGVDVSDFISNTGVKVSSIATNFNGETNVVRADSIYFLDEGLRLKGASVAPTGAPGMDMNYNHAFAAGQGGTPTFGGTGNPNDRLLFAARPDGNIDIFDTFFYGKVGSIPVRDPIIGPLRVAKDQLGNQLLFGITARGLTVVRLPTVVNPFPIRQAGGN